MEKGIRKYAVIVAAGSGQRAGGGLPKQFHEIAGRPMLWHSVRAFLSEDQETRIILVLSEDGVNIWSSLAEKLPEEDRAICRTSVKIVKGGATRTGSVANALALIETECGNCLNSDNGADNGADKSLGGGPSSIPKVLIAVHDAARPMVSIRVIRDGWLKGYETGAAVPVVPVTDSIRILNEEGGSSAVDRSRYVAVQTPQVFDGMLLVRSYAHMNPERQYTDDASVVEDRHPVALFDGDPANFKVTMPHDFMIAEQMFRSRESDGKAHSC